MGNDTGPYRVYNHTDRELIIATDENKHRQYRLLPRSVSPRNETPRYLWEAQGERIDDVLVWQLVPGYDVHVSQTAAEATVGAAPPPSTTVGPAAKLHIAGLGTFATLEDKRPDITAQQAWFYSQDDIWVTVLGAGITGLTVAHELATRGFRVQVIERAHGSPADIMDGDTGLARFRRGLKTPDIGGIARTQWATQPLARAGEGGIGVGATGTNQLESLHSIHGDAIWFGADGGGVQMLGRGDYQSFGVTWTDDKLDDFAERLETWLRGRGRDRSVAAVQLVVVVYGGADENRVAHAYRRLHNFLSVLADADEAQDKPVASLRATLDRLQVLPTARIDVPEPEPEPGSTGSTYVGLIVRVHEDLGLIAGEHGFRFFPGFYRHLRDTMQRTPIFDPVTQTFTPRTALDNLQDVAWQVIVDPRRSRLAVSRKPFNTLGGLIEQYQTLRRDTGYRPIDLLRYSLRMLRYMTSSTQRRAAYYENMTWWTFLSKPHLDDPSDEAPFAYGERFARALRHLPRALVAMDAERADARTLGNISVQLVMDQFGLHDRSDSTLTGPTSTSWLSHWRRFLEEQGVRFFLGEVTRIDIAGGEKPVRARVDITFADLQTPTEYLDGEAMLRDGLISEHYIVSALDLPSLARIAAPLRVRGYAGVFRDLNQLVTDRDNVDRDLEDITAIGHGGEYGGLEDRFQTLTGIQLYYQHHVSFANGHIYFADSPWGLSAISQVQFWGPFGTGHRGRLTGNLSVDIGSWRADGRTPDPNRLERDAIARLVQDQINQPADDKVRLMTHARYYHLDDFIGLGPLTIERDLRIIVPRRNQAPFLINLVNDWSNRPRGEPWSPNEPEAQDREPGGGTTDGDLWTPERGGYVVHFGNLVVAGTHMRTFTRMTTMEAANESARHAVNTILDHATHRWRRSRLGRPDTASGGDQPTPNINVNKSTTPFGDYCDIWNPEHLELQDLEFLRAIDDHLMDAGSRTRDDDVPPGTRRPYAPHLFDILRIDELPDLLEGDREVLNALELIGAILKAFDSAQVNDLPSVLAMVDGARKKLAALFHRAAR
jgi:uncharacterized protein with NAD-binding domain and iron-sulfur cluster